MQKKSYEAPDLIAYGTIEAITGGQSYFSPQTFTDGSRTSAPKHDWGDKDKHDWGWGWGWPWGWGR